MSPPVADGDSTYEVAKLLDRLAGVVGSAFPEEIWVRGQIRNLSRSRRGHVYFDLVTPAAADQSPDAALPVVLFDWFRKVVNRVLGPGAAGQMTDGTEVRIRGMVSVYAARGQLQLQMKAIDPHYTLSRMADERDRLLAKLAASGLLQRNRAVPLRALPLRVALVTSAASAAAGDFKDVLARSGIGWEVLVVDTPVQGFGSEQRIAAALASAGRREVDAMALVRGGGARTELAPFDSSVVAHAIAHSPVPVLTGIGHEIDRSVADIVAHAAHNTPTACAAALVEHARRFDRAALELWRGIDRAVVARLAADRRLLEVAAQRTGAAVSSSCRSARSEMRRLATAFDRAANLGVERARWQLDAHIDLVAARAAAHLAGHRRLLAAGAGALRIGSSHALETQRRRLAALAAQVRAYDPQSALERGWSITTDSDGRLIRSVREVSPGARLRTRMRDGIVASTAATVTATDQSWSEDD